MAPFQWAPEGTSGLQYVVSFAIGATIVTCALWLVLFFYHVKTANAGESLRDAYMKLPSLHFKVMWLPGFTAGTIWAIGNAASILAVQSLGEGLGYSLCQASLVISGFWGIFFFREITSSRQISFWLLSAVVTVVGMIIVSAEHISLQ